MEQHYRYWGKSVRTNVIDGIVHLLVYHCLDVAAVGKKYLQENLVIQGALAAKMGLYLLMRKCVHRRRVHRRRGVSRKPCIW